MPNLTLETEFRSLATTPAEGVTLTAEEKAIRKLVGPINEAFRNEKSFIDAMRRLKTRLSVERLPKSLKGYLKTLDELITHYEALPFKEVDQDLPLSELIHRANAYYHSEAFKTYAQTVSKLGLHYESVNKIIAAHPRLYDPTELQGYTSRPFQHMPRFAMPWEGVLETLKKIPHEDSITPLLREVEAIVSTTKNLAKSFNIQLALQDYEPRISSIKNAHERELLCLREILALNINTTLEKPESRDVNLAITQRLLSLGFPSVYVYDPRKQEIWLKAAGDAFGHIMSNRAIAIYGSATSIKPFNPRDFNPEKLDSLYHVDKNPMWIVLKSTIPVDPPYFSAQDKISCYQDLADRALKGELGSTGKYLIALNLQKSAFAIAKSNGAFETYDAAFGPDSIIGRYITRKINEHDSPEKSISRKELDSSISTFVEECLSKEGPSVEAAIKITAAALASKEHIVEQLQASQHVIDDMAHMITQLQQWLASPTRANMAHIKDKLATLNESPLLSQLSTLKAEAHQKETEITALMPELARLKERHQRAHALLGDYADVAHLRADLNKQLEIINRQEQQVHAMRLELREVNNQSDAMRERLTQLTANQQVIKNSLTLAETQLDFETAQQQLDGMVFDTTKRFLDETASTIEAIKSLHNSSETLADKIRWMDNAFNLISEPSDLGLEGLLNLNVQLLATKYQLIQTRPVIEELNASNAQQTEALVTHVEKMNDLLETFKHLQAEYKILSERYAHLFSERPELDSTSASIKIRLKEMIEKTTENKVSILICQKNSREILNTSEGLMQRFDEIVHQLDFIVKEIEPRIKQIIATKPNEPTLITEKDIGQRQTQLEPLLVDLSETITALRAQVTEETVFKPAPRHNATLPSSPKTGPLQSVPALSFNEFYTAFAKNFYATNSDGIKMMIRLMKDMKDEAISDDEKFKIISSKMHAIAKERVNNEWLKGNKFGFGNGRDPAVQKLYEEMSKEGFSLMDEAIKQRVREAKPEKDTPSFKTRLNLLFSPEDKEIAQPNETKAHPKPKPPANKT